MSKPRPTVSIFMPVFNGEKFLSQALSSIQNQTYPNWELIAVDDWSEDHSWEILKKYESTDSRITAYRNGKHWGVASAANLALSKIRGDYVARMDADDVMHPERLAKQVAFLQHHGQTVAVGAQCQLIDTKGKILGIKTFPQDHRSIYRMIFRSIPLQQPSLMVNRKLLPQNYRWYKEGEETAEEVDLLFRLFQFGSCANLKDYLLSYRIHPDNTSLKDPKKTFFVTLRSRVKAIMSYGYRPHLADISITLLQMLIVSLLPKKLIFPLYNRLRQLEKEPSQNKGKQTFT
ncbi:MAG: glycosyltransferase family 2 protein [Patescibacteria group bacterium]|jgi:glycosyltransferase involved in cell wall biosynthesis